MKRQTTRWTKFVVGICINAAILANLPNAISANDPTISPTSASFATKKPVTTDSGLQYFELTLGHGAVAQAGNTVLVHYTGWLQNVDGGQGKKFDSSRDRGEPLIFSLGQGQVIKGWDEGVQGMKVGGERRLIIPAALAYGAHGAGGVIPPNAILIFDVELVKVK